MSCKVSVIGIGLCNLNSIHKPTTCPCAGPVPSELGQLSNLQELYLPANQLQGRCEVDILAAHLHTLRSYPCAGSIPSELEQLTKLEWLNLSHNQLEGACLCSTTTSTQTENFPSCRLHSL